MKILTVGAGYVGLSTAAVFAKKFETKIFDIDENRLTLIANNICPFEDTQLTDLLSNNKLSTTKNFDYEIGNSDIIILALPTDFKPSIQSFNTSIITETMRKISDQGFQGIVVIKSTVPIGYASNMQEIYPNLSIISCPEFLREGRAAFDTQRPSRIILGGDYRSCLTYSNQLLEVISDKSPVLYMTNSEAEATKLFANTYLASRVAFFNEIDTFCRLEGFQPDKVIKGISMDERIGMFYNNPSFGYGGYCLPKDTLQCAKLTSSHYAKIIHSIHNSNENRKNYFAEQINRVTNLPLGVYRIVMKHGSDNFRESSTVDILKRTILDKSEILIYEPNLKGADFLGIPTTSDLSFFLSCVSTILANRYDCNLANFQGEIITADIFGTG